MTPHDVLIHRERKLHAPECPCAQCKAQRLADGLDALAQRTGFSAASKLAADARELHGHLLSHNARHFEVG